MAWASLSRCNSTCHEKTSNDPPPPPVDQEKRDDYTNHSKTPLHWGEEKPINKEHIKAFGGQYGFRGPNIHPKSRSTKKNTAFTRTFFRKVRVNFSLLPCDTSQEPNGNCSEKLVQMNFFILGGFFRVDFPPLRLGSVPGTVWRQVLGHPGRPDLISVQFHIDWTECLQDKRDISTGQTGHVHKMAAVQKWGCPAEFLYCGVAKGSSISWVAKFKGDKSSACKLSNGWSRSYRQIKLLLSAGI